jgi:hypothetical protein
MCVCQCCPLDQLQLSALAAAVVAAAAAAAADDVFMELTDEFADVLELDNACAIDDGGSCFDPIRKAKREAEQAAALQQSADTAAGML